MDKWTEIRSAFLVAKFGTVSAAANILGVHRATVNRHIDALEEVLGAKLFQRHARGYTPTEAGRDMLDTASRAEEMFNGLAGRTYGSRGQLSGELIISALPGVAPLIMPSLAEFRSSYPEVNLEFVAESRIASLEYGEAHLAIRAGAKPEEPDYVVIPFGQIQFGLYAHERYITQYGRPNNIEDVDGHYFVGSLNESIRAPYGQWMRKNLSAEMVSLKAVHPMTILQGVLSGLGLGFLADYEAKPHEGLVQVIQPRDEWAANLWIVSHVDLYRTAKVQEFVKILKSSMDDMPR